MTLQEVLNQELTAIELESIEFEELEEILAAGVGCKDASCAGSCSSKPSLDGKG